MACTSNISGTQRFKYFATPSQFSPQYQLFPIGQEKVANLSKGLPKRWQKSNTKNKPLNDQDTYDSSFTPNYHCNQETQNGVLKRKKKRPKKKDTDSTCESQSPKSAILDEIRLERELWQKEKKEKELMLSNVVDEESIKHYQTILEENEKKGFELKEKEMDEIIELKMKAITERIQNQFGSKNDTTKNRVQSIRETKMADLKNRVSKDRKRPVSQSSGRHDIAPCNIDELTYKEVYRRRKIPTEHTFKLSNDRKSQQYLRDLSLMDSLINGK